jgi:hypothetical protein
VLAAAAIAGILLAVAANYGGGSSRVGHVKLVTAVTATPATPTAQTDPFAAPGAKADYSVPPPSRTPLWCPR